METSPPSYPHYKGVQPPLYDHDPKGPDNNNYEINNKKHSNKNTNIIIIIIIIIIGPFGVMVIRGGWTPLFLTVQIRWSRIRGFTGSRLRNLQEVIPETKKSNIDRRILAPGVLTYIR